MVASSSWAMLFQSTRCRKTLHSRHVFVERILIALRLCVNSKLDQMLCVLA